MAEVLKKQRKSNFSPEEVDVLVRTVEKNYETLYGEFSKRAIFRGDRHQAWLDVTKEVNQVSLEKRTLQEVKNKWKKCQHLLYRSDESGIITGPDEIAKSDDANVWELLTSIDEDEDSMPLQQRLQAPAGPAGEPAPVLHSQPLSPTKLKVTRHSKPACAAAVEEEVRLKWNAHHANMQSAFPGLLLREQYVDATLVAEGQTLKCHRVILSSCSTYFEDVLASISPYQHPVLFMKDIPFWILKALCDYMYAGEVHILQTKLNELLAAAEHLKIKGLTEPPVADTPAVKTEPQEPIKEETREEEEIKELKKREEKDLRKKEEPRKKDDKDVKKKDEGKKKEEVKDKKRNQVTPPPDMPVLKSAKLAKVAPHTEMPNLSKNSRNSKVGVSRRSAKRAEKVQTVTKEPSGDFLDPLDLLQPVYEEVTKDPPITSTPKELKSVPVKRPFTKRLKKRKITDDREDSPQPVLSRKGTRSRPNRKVPKFYHSNFDNSTIVREPHTDQADPLMQLQEIKSEPLYLEENTIEIEDNLVGFSEQEITIEEEEIMGNYDSPIVNFSKDLQLEPLPDTSTKSDNALEIVNVDDIRGPTGQKGIGLLEEDPLHVQNVIESNDNALGFRISEVVTEKEDSRSTEDLGFQITSVVSEKEDGAANEKIIEETGDMPFQISNVQSEVEEPVSSGVGGENAYLTVSTNLGLIDNQFENGNEVAKENPEESLPGTETLHDEVENPHDTRSKENEAVDEASYPDVSSSETSVFTGFQSTDVQSTYNDDDSEKMQVDDDLEEMQSEGKASKMDVDHEESNCLENFAVHPEVQTDINKNSHLQCRTEEFLTQPIEELPECAKDCNSGVSQDQYTTEEMRAECSIENALELRPVCSRNTEELEFADCHLDSKCSDDIPVLNVAGFRSPIDIVGSADSPLDSNCSDAVTVPNLGDFRTPTDIVGSADCPLDSNCSDAVSAPNLGDFRTPTDIIGSADCPLDSNCSDAVSAPSLGDFRTPTDIIGSVDCPLDCSDSVPVTNLGDFRTTTDIIGSADGPLDSNCSDAVSVPNLGDFPTSTDITRSADYPLDSNCSDAVSAPNLGDFRTPIDIIGSADCPLDSNCSDAVSVPNLGDFRPPIDIIGSAEYTLDSKCSADGSEPNLADFRTPTDIDESPDRSSVHPRTAIEPPALLPALNLPEVGAVSDQTECLQGFSPDEPGFHIAQLAIEQIAQNEEHRLAGHGPSVLECEKKSSCSNSNDLETIVNDLTKIVGGSGSAEDEEDSSAIVESLENLLNE